MLATSQVFDSFTDQKICLKIVILPDFYSLLKKKEIKFSKHMLNFLRSFSLIIKLFRFKLINKEENNSPHVLF